ncbi:MAG: hypothetical protein HYZ11_09440 [Candidatus Tectomicrobia bacterium]|uniref:Inositol monophosphatase n=1 Tax=Tectimicrobiota bacterium TaxID=2528274 RepID=A0A932HY23_UNCTE|nr:hypothetical protein [Candidatus Tectomicrobia bacterium]
MLAFIEETLREAGALALSLAAGASAERKEDRSLVSEADREVERLILARLARRFPGDPVLAEESGGLAPGAALSPAGRLWAVDPIDGTNPYLHGLPTWGVAVGVMREGAPLAGGFFMPAAGEMFLAERGRGATRNGRPLAPLGPREVDNQTLFFGPASRKRFYKLDFPGKTVAYGCAAAHVAYAAAGAAFCSVVDRPRLWDILGPMAVLAETGGWAYHPDGRPLGLEGLARGEKADGPVFFGLRENAERVFPMLERFEKPRF